MVKSFLFNESGFVAPWTALSGSWISGILIGTATLFGAVSSVLAEPVCDDYCWNIQIVLDCEGYDSCELSCSESGNICECYGECS